MIRQWKFYLLFIITYVHDSEHLTSSSSLHMIRLLRTLPFSPHCVWSGFEGPTSSSSLRMIRLLRTLPLAPHCVWSDFWGFPSAHLRPHSRSCCRTLNCTPPGLSPGGGISVRQSLGSDVPPRDVQSRSSSATPALWKIIQIILLPITN